MDSGGKIRTGKILEQLSKHHDITLISNIEPSKDDPYLAQIDKLCSKFVPVQWKEIRKFTPLFFLRLFFQMFSIYPVSVLNDYSKRLQAAVEEELTKNSYDITICDFVQSALMFRNVKKIPTILFQHNVESMIAKRHIRQNNNILAKLFWWLQWKKMLWFEKKVCNRFDTVIAVSEADRNIFNKLYKTDNIKIIPTGVDVDYYKPIPNYKVKENSLVFCGSMDWLPNEDAMIFFIQDILPVIKKKISDVSLTVVGRNPSPHLIKIIRENPEIELTGWVEDTRPYIAQCALFIVPIRIGGGTRMKIFEAMAMGKVVVSTSIGAEGLPIDNGKNIVIEDSPIVFAQKINELLLPGNDRISVESNALELVQKNFTWSVVAKRFLDICDSLI